MAAFAESLYLFADELYFCSPSSARLAVSTRSRFLASCSLRSRTLPSRRCRHRSSRRLVSLFFPVQLQCRKASPSFTPFHRSAKACRRHGTGGEEGARIAAADPGHLSRQGVEAQGIEAGSQSRAPKEACQVRNSCLHTCDDSSSDTLAQTGTPRSGANGRSARSRSSLLSKAGRRSARRKAADSPRSARPSRPSCQCCHSISLSD